MDGVCTAVIVRKKIWDHHSPPQRGGEFAEGERGGDFIPAVTLKEIFQLRGSVFAEKTQAVQDNEERHAIISDNSHPQRCNTEDTKKQKGALHNQCKSDVLP